MKNEQEIRAFREGIRKIVEYSDSYNGSHKRGMLSAIDWILDNDPVSVEP